MHLNKTHVARKINSLARVKAKLEPLLIRERELSLLVKDAGGGESGKWVASVVAIPAHVKRMPAHDQLRLTPK